MTELSTADDVIAIDLPFLAHGGRMGALIRAFPWSAHPMGHPADWPLALRQTLSNCLAAPNPTAIYWGRDLRLLYNDAWSPIPADRHPWALGRAGGEVWADIWDVVGPQFETVLDTGTGFAAKNQLLWMKRDGVPQETYWNYSFSPIRDDAGRIAGVLNVGNETTSSIFAERMLLDRERSLADSEAKFRAITDSIDHMVWSTRPDGYNDYHNQRWYDYLGVSEGSTDGGAWIDMLHPDDQERARLVWRNSLETGADYHIEYRLRHRSGLYRWVLARAQPVRDIRGRIVRWFGTCTDIQDLVDAREVLTRSREELERLVAIRTAERDQSWRNSVDLLTVIDLQGVFQSTNPAWSTILGWDADEIEGQSYLDFIHPDDHGASRGALAHATGSALPIFENRYRHKDGSYRSIAWTAAPEGDRIYATGRDVTQEKQRAAELAATQDALRQSQKMEAVGQLTGGIAHDFNNLLQVVTGSLDLLIRRLPPSDSRLIRSAENALAASQRAATLTQRLLAFARRQALVPKPVNVNALILGMADLLRRTLGETIEIEAVLAPEVWLIEADHNQLESAIVNLAVNARDAMSDGGSLMIETANREFDGQALTGPEGLLPGQYVILCVTDTGTGMNEETLSRAFEPFFTTKDVGKGTGLGLSQVFGFVKQSGGQVKISSAVGEGTGVKMYFPRFMGVLVEDDATAIVKQPPVGERTTTILVVEDNDDVRELSVSMLRDLGYRVIEAHDGPSGLRLLERHSASIDLLFSDIVLPGGMSGDVLAQEARRRIPGLKVLFTSGYERSSLVRDGRVAAGVQLITKPFGYNDLAARVRGVLDAAARQ